jgi:hypothetical protein
VKTTIEIPDDLLRRSKIKAAERGSTLKELVIHGLERVISDDFADDSTKTKHRQAMQVFLSGFRFNNSVSAAGFDRKELYEDR